MAAFLRPMFARPACYRIAKWFLIAALPLATEAESLSCTESGCQRNQLRRRPNGVCVQNGLSNNQ